jgi:hypothetical protein
MFLGLNDINPEQKEVIAEFVTDNGTVVPVTFSMKSIHQQHSHH